MRDSAAMQERKP